MTHEASVRAIDGRGSSLAAIGRELVMTATSRRLYHGASAVLLSQGFRISLSLSRLAVLYVIAT